MLAPKSWLENDNIVESREREVYDTAGVDFDHFGKIALFSGLPCGCVVLSPRPNAAPT